MLVRRRVVLAILNHVSLKTLDFFPKSGQFYNPQCVTVNTSAEYGIGQLLLVFIVTEPLTIHVF